MTQQVVEYCEFNQISEIATNVAIQIMFKVLETKKYNASKTSEWTDLIGNGVIEKLKSIAPYFKFVVSCFIIQKVGAGLHLEAIGHWDPKTDGSVTAKFENDNVICLCTVIGVSI